MKMLRRSTALVATALILAVGGTACSSDSSTSSTCDDLQTLAEQIRELPKMALSPNAEDDINKQMDDIDSTLDDLKASGDDQFGKDIDDLKAAFSDLGDAFTESDSLSDTADNVKSALGDVSDASQKLLDDAKDEFSDCDLTASPTSD